MMTPAERDAIQCLVVPQPKQEPKPICEHCGKKIVNRKHIVCERQSGPSTYKLHFHGKCWKCPKCGTNGPHYCPADIARD